MRRQQTVPSIRDGSSEPVRHKLYRRRRYLALFLFLFAVYLLTYTPHINSSDGLAMFSTAESLVRRGALDIEQIRWMGLQQGTYGLDGLLYSRKGIGLPLGLLPLTWLGLVVPWFGTVGVSLLFNAIVTALTGVLLPAYLQTLGYNRRPALMVALTFGLFSLAWPYAKSLFSDPFSGLLLLASAYLLLKFHRALKINSSESKIHKGMVGGHPHARRACTTGPPWHGDARATKFSFPLSPSSKKPAQRRRVIIFYPFLAGFLLGWNVATRYAELLFLPVFGLLLLFYIYNAQTQVQPHSRSFTLHHAWRSFLIPSAAFLTPLLLIGLSLIGFNLFRYGDPFNTGYLPNETFSTVLWQGVLGQLISPGRGLLLYCPIFFLSFVGLPIFLRRFRAEALLALAVILIHLFLYGKWFMWHGGFAWGPRFMVPTLPFWALLLAPVAVKAFGDKAEVSSQPDIDKTSHYTKTRQGHSQLIFRILFIALALLSLIPQILAVSLDFTPFQGYLLDTGLPLFDPQTFFEIRYSPLLQAWRFVRLDTLDLAWAWQGQINGRLLAVLVVNVGLAGYFLKRGSKPARERISEGTKGQKDISPEQNYAELSPGFRVAVPAVARDGVSSSAILQGLALVSTVMTVIFLLSHTHTLPNRSIEKAVNSLNQTIRPDDAVILNQPGLTVPFAELYKGRAPVLGLNQGDTLPEAIERRLAETITAHPQVWWLPNWLPPEESAIEQTLLATGFPARNEIFEGQRLALFATPNNLSAWTRPVNRTFQHHITLLSIAFPPVSSPGTALPVELQWRAAAPIAQNYHLFVHLLTEDGRLLAQADGQPVHWTRPTSTWAVDEIIPDRHGLWLPPEIEPGRYRLRVGLYQPASGQRLTLPDGSDGLEFKVTVE